jgi:prophage regulatory protein
MDPAVKAHDAAPALDRLLRRSEVSHLTGLSKTSIYREIALGRFPAPVRLGPNSVAWRESTIAKWMAALPAAKAAS